jgi:hypothetical protein
MKPTQRAHMSVGTDTTQVLQQDDENGMLKYLYHESDSQLKVPPSGDGDNFQTLSNFMRNGFQVDVKVTRSPRPEEPERGSKHIMSEFEERLSMERRIEEVQSRMVQLELTSKRAASQLKVVEDSLPPLSF